MSGREEKSRILVRPARTEDAAALPAIYAPYVEQTAITFEYEVPSEEEFRQCGYKFGHWYNMVWMEKIIGPHEGAEPVRPFREVMSTKCS